MKRYLQDNVMRYLQDNVMRLCAVMLVLLLMMAGVLPDPALAGMLATGAFLVGDTSNYEEIKKLLGEQGKAWADFKATVEEAQKKGNAESAEVKSKLDKINGDLDRLSTALKDVEIRTQRMALMGTDAEGKGLTPEQQEHKKAFGQFMRRGNEQGLRDIEAKAMSVGSDPDGGYFVPEDTSGRMVSKIFETSPIRAHASVQSISTDALEGPNDLNDGVSGGWVGEKSARPETGTPQTGKWRIPVHEMYAFPFATQSLLDDSAINIEAWLMGKTTSKMERDETTAFFSGNGVNKPRGFLTYPTAATADGARAWGTFEHVSSGASGAFAADPAGAHALIDLVHKPKVAYRSGGKFFMNRATLGTVRKLKDSNGNFLWLPTLAAGQLSTLLGYPVVEAEDMPAIAANSLSIAFGDMATTYQIVDRIGFRVLRDPLTNKPYVGFYVTRRVGGDVLHFEALKFIKFA